MKIVKQGGGTSIGVYNPDKCNLERVKKLLKQERIDFLMPADYSEGSKIENIVKAVLKKVKAESYLSIYNGQQEAFVDSLDEVEKFVVYTKDFLINEDGDEERLKSLRKQGKNIVKRMKREIEEEFIEVGGEKEIKIYMEQKSAEIMKLFDKKEKKIKKNREKKE